jgi:hypothetical protein
MKWARLFVDTRLEQRGCGAFCTNLDAGCWGLKPERHLLAFGGNEAGTLRPLLRRLLGAEVSIG